MKETHNKIQTICFLSIMLEESETELINAIAPGTMVACDRPKRNNQGFMRDDEPRFTPETIKKVIYENEILAKYLHITPLQSLLFVTAFNQNTNGADFDSRDICRFLQINNMEFLQLKSEFDALVEKQYFIPDRDRQFSDCINYNIHPSLKDAIIEDKPIDKNLLSKEKIDRYKFVKSVSDLIESRTNDDASTRQLYDAISSLEETHQELPFLQNVMKLHLEISERTLFYEICDDFINVRSHQSEIDCTLKDIYDNIHKRMKIAKALKEEKHNLQKMGYIEITRGDMFNDSCMILTEKGKHLFLEDDFELFNNEPEDRSKSLLYPDQIAEKQLFYDDGLKKQLRLFTENLEEDKFGALQKRLEKQALPKGVAALFYGTPGTGKTETVMQIARATGRAVCHVNISAAKSCWYGESQKLVKNIFTNYARMCEKEKLKPILLFNEADALFSSRQNINNIQGSSSVMQTENAIQNIILEEMEKLDGILIATTNMINNLDSAFARRFLFKIQFGQPSVEAKMSIWKSKLNWLQDNDCKLLANKYNFSGGEIDNIVRKIMMEEVLNGERPDITTIEELCKNEKIEEKSGKIGFVGK